MNCTASTTARCVWGKSLYWNVLGLWQNIQDALSLYSRDHHAPLDGIGVDTWGVDFALLDRDGRLLGNPHHYRDPRTDGVMDEIFAQLPKPELYARTGLQFMQINTLYQLYSMKNSVQFGGLEWPRPARHAFGGALLGS